MNGRAAQDIGNTTNLASPIRSPRRTDGRHPRISPPPARRRSRSPAVNLGIGTASSAIGLALGSVNGALNLDVVLSALEESGNGSILSTPRVSTQTTARRDHARRAGAIQTVANNTVTGRSETRREMNVTPQITAAIPSSCRSCSRTRRRTSVVRRRHPADQHTTRGDVAACVGWTDIGHRWHLHQLPGLIERQDARALQDSDPGLVVSTA